MSSIKATLSFLRKLTGVAIGIALIASSSFAYAQTSKLDAPISTKPTVGVEIKRGADTAFECFSKNLSKYRAFVECLNNEIHSNQQNNTKSDPYMLGLSIVALVDGQASNGGQEDPLWFPFWRKNIARIVKADKLTDTDLCAALDFLKCDVVKRIVSGAK
jgi:hypothetical protein